MGILLANAIDTSYEVLEDLTALQNLDTSDFIMALWWRYLVNIFLN